MNKIPPEVQLVIDRYLERLNVSLPGLAKGFYLVGSLAFNDYVQGQSDIDFLCLVSRMLSSDDVSFLRSIHQDIHSKYPQSRLEGVFVTTRQIGSPNRQELYYYNGRSIRFGYGSGNANITTWSVLKRYGIVVTGPSPKEFMVDVESSQLVDFVQKNVKTYWYRWVKRISSVFTWDGILALFDRKIEWGVLGLCRLFYTTKERDITSKRHAGEYALNRVPSEFAAIINEALRIRDGKSGGFYRSPFKRRKDTILFMQYMINRIVGSREEIDS